MVNQNHEAAAPDVFADTFQVMLNVNGSVLIFGKGTPQVPNPFAPPDQAGQINMGQERTALIRMTNEHLKQMVFLTWKAIVQNQQQMGQVINVPKPILDGMGIDQTQWAAFWQEVANATQPVPEVPAGTAPPDAPVGTVPAH